MKTLKEVRFVATNFFNLQGLRAIPIGLCLIFVCLWANRFNGITHSFLVPVSLLAGFGILLIVIDHYYLRVFGRVQRTPESRRLEWLVSIVTGILAIAAFWLDVSFKLSVSLIGLVCGVGLLFDYIRITWLVKERFLLYYPLGAIVLLIMTILPLLGVPDWWQVFGLKTQLYGMALLIGVYSILSGIWGHLYLAHTLSPLQEAQ